MVALGSGLNLIFVSSAKIQWRVMAAFEIAFFVLLMVFVSTGAYCDVVAFDLGKHCNLVLGLQWGATCHEGCAFVSVLYL